MTETFHGNKTKAQERWRDRQSEIDGKRFIPPAKKALTSYLTEWLPRAADDLRPTTVSSYGQMVRAHISPGLGSVTLSDLTPNAVQAWVDGMRAGKGPEGHVVGARTAAYARTVLRIALQDAVRLGLLATNPVDRTKPPKQAPRHVEAFTIEETAVLFGRADSTRLRPLLEVALYTGLRRGELLGLRWEDVDLDGAMVLVQRSRVNLGGTRRGHEQAPKTEAGIRSVALPAPAVAALRVQFERRRHDKEAAGPAYEDRGYVFATALGNPLGPTDVSREFRRLRDSAPCPGCKRPTSPIKVGSTEYHCRHCDRQWEGGGLPRLPFHALRHSSASLMIAAGVPAEVGAKRLGHKRISTYVDTYGHLLQQANRDAASALDSFLSRAGVGLRTAENGPENGPGTPGNATDGTILGGQRPRPKPLRRKTLRHRA